MEYGEKISALRKSKGMTQADLGNELNVTYQAVSKWERGESYPDFETLSKIAKIFGVPITYFEDGVVPENNETAAAAPARAPVMLGVCKGCGKVVYEGSAGATSPSLLCTDCAEKQLNEPPEPAYSAPARPVMLGVCTVCGKVVYQGNAGATSPALICSDCVQRKRKEKQQAVENERIKAKREKQFEKDNAKRIRNRGLIGGGVAGAIVLIAAIVLTIINTSQAGLIWGGFAVLTVLAFTFVSQLFWDGIVVDIVFAGFKIIGTPGIIFTFDLDGFIFLIAMKILFAILKFVVLIICMLVCLLAAILVSLFSFIPATVKLSLGKAD